MGEQRPLAAAVVSGAELRRWYWLRSELLELARARGISTAGGKVELTDRLAADLDGAPAPHAAARVRLGGQLRPPLTETTIIPAGQRSSQVLRAWFTQRLGPSFRFDAAMRAFLAAGGATLGEAAEFWRTGRRPPNDIDAQFEWNRFTRAWHAQHPGGDRRDLLLAWAEYRSLPADARPP